MEEKVIQLIAEILDAEEGTISAETRAEDVERWDSVAQVLIVGALENELGISIPIEEAAEIESVAGFLEIVREKK